MQKTLGLSAVLLAFALTGCGGGGPAGFTISSASPTGKFGGAAWSMTKANVSKSGDRLSVKMYSDQVADCANSSGGGGYLLFSMPATVGKRPLKFSFDENGQTVTFVTPPSDNNIATEGLLDLKELTDTSVTLGLHVKASASNEIDGTFTTMLCK